jgi:hypothetical protein
MGQEDAVQISEFPVPRGGGAREDEGDRDTGVAVVFERKIALRNKWRVVSYLRTQNDAFGR